MYFADRQDAGRRLAAELLRFKDRRPVILALPRGGVPVGFEVAMRLGAPLDVVLVRKIGHPASPELAIGAIADVEGLEKVIDEEAIAEFGIPRAYLDREILRQQREIDKRRRLYFEGRRPAELGGGTAIVIDDGIATGATMRAALRAVRRRAPKTLVLAVPVAPADTIEELRSEADETVCLFSPKDFGAVGLFYADFRPIEDDTVVDLLKRAAAMAATRPISAPPPARNTSRT
jgi:putative phosphoribosyl transferase